MKSHNGRYVITFNGEIYNHLKLRKSLETENLTSKEWDGKSDTETLLACIEAYGIEIVLKLVGMFAFAVWDRKVKKLYLVRDRFGEKPLFWGLLNSKQISKTIPYLQAIYRYYFCFIIDSKRTAGVNLEVDPESQASFLNYGVTEPLSIYKNINKLPPNSIFEFSSNSEGFFSNKEPLKIKYWDFVLFT